jgi:hypothetical protein
MFSHGGDNGAMTAFEHLLKSCDIRDQLDDIASSDPPAYLRRCFAEGISASALSLSRVQQLAVCAMVLDSILNDRDYEPFEPELIADWRTHYGSACARMKETAVAALRHAQESPSVAEPEISAEIGELERRLVSA